jgi:hypothetical protein
MWASALDKGLGPGGEVCIVRQSQPQVWPYSSGVPEKLFSRVSIAWQLVHPEEAVLLGVISIPCHEDVISSVLPGI